MLDTAPSPQAAVTRGQVGARAGRRQRQLRLEQIVDAAEALFSEASDEEPSIDAIAHRAGMAKGTLYHYFRDRADLLTAMRLRRSQRLSDSAAAAVAACAPDCWSTRIEAWVRAAVQQHGCDTALSDKGSKSPVSGAYGIVTEDPVVLGLVRLIEEGQDANAWHSGNAIDAATFLVFGMQGVIDGMGALGLDQQSVMRSVTANFTRFLSLC